MMSGALANNIQEVIRVQGKFGDVEDGVEKNQIEIKKLANNLELKTDELAIAMRSMLKDLTSRLDVISINIEDMDKNALKARKKLTTDLGDLANELGIIGEKVVTLTRDFRTNEEKLSSIDNKVGKVDGSLKRTEAKVDKIDNDVSDLKAKVDAIPASDE